MTSSTLLQESAAAFANGDVVRAAIIKIFAEASPLLSAFPFMTIGGDTYKYTVEGALPTADFRDVNESYTPNNGVLNPEIETLKICGGEIRVDTAEVETRPGTLNRHTDMKVKAMSQKIGYQLIKGSLSTDRKGFVGLEDRLVIGDSQVVENGSTSGGDALSIAKLDQAIDLCEGPTHLLMLKQQRRSMTSFLQSSPSIQTGRDEFGRQLFKYNDLPILIADQFGDTPALTATEAGLGGGTTSCSIYVLHLEEGYLSGLQAAPMRVKDLGEMQERPAYGVRIEWIVGEMLAHPRAAVRLRGIKTNTAAVA